MRYVKLFAGLGNQLFQYSYGLWLRAHGERVRFVLSPSPGCIADVFELGDPSILELGNPVALALTKVWARYVERGYEVGFHQKREYAEIARESGHFDFRREAHYARSPWADAAGRANAVSVHVRGGDYLTEGTEGVYGSVCGPEYYRRSLALVSERVPDAEFLVLTDDRDYAARVLQNAEREYRFVRDESFDGDPGFDLWVMRTCGNHVIANSTFSWWGAFLGATRGGVTVCPDKWTNDGSVELDGLVPPEWIRAPAGDRLGEKRSKKDNR